jgi:adenylate cyclase
MQPWAHTPDGLDGVPVARVFLSYARDDAARAEAIASALERAGHDVWWDRQIHGGSRFTKEIDQALKNADAVVVLWSEASVESAWVHDEAAEGRESDRLFPVTLDGSRPPLGFRQYQCIDFSDTNRKAQSAAVASLIAAISARVNAEQGQRAREDKPSIAVLPFTNMSGDPEQEYFSDGITEDIITDLSKISGLFVVGRNTSFTYKHQSVQLPGVASELGVRFLLEGSVRKAGQRVRVTAQLIDGASGGHLWADRYDRELTDVFAIQDEITRCIVEQLKIRLLPAEKKAIGQAQTTNFEAYDYYLKGRQFYHNTTRNYLMLARRMFEKALELDPAYARAYAGIASCDTRLNEWYAAANPTADILALADKAIELEPGLAEAHAARGVALADANRHEEAEAAFKRALELDPNSYDAAYSYARHSMTQGKAERAAELFVRGFEIQPDDAQCPLLAALIFNKLGQMDEAEKYGRIGLRRAQEALRRHPESSRPAQLGACVLAGLGQKDQAREWLARALAIDPEDNAARYNAACCLAQLGDTERALDLLEIWVKQRGSEAKRWMLVDPDIDPIRDDPRYKAIVEQMK